RVLHDFWLLCTEQQLAKTSLSFLDERGVAAHARDGLRRSWKKSALDDGDSLGISQRCGGAQEKIRPVTRQRRGVSVQAARFPMLAECLETERQLRVESLRL